MCSMQSIAWLLWIWGPLEANCSCKLQLAHSMELLCHIENGNQQGLEEQEQEAAAGPGQTHCGSTCILKHRKRDTHIRKSRHEPIGVRGFLRFWEVFPQPGLPLGFLQFGREIGQGSSGNRSSATGEPGNRFPCGTSFPLTEMLTKNALALLKCQFGMQI